MRVLPRSILVPSVALLLALLAACNADKPGTGEAGREASKAGEAADKDAVPGLPTEKDRNSYMVGMALAKQFEPMKDEIDVDVVVRGLRDALEGKKTLLTTEQAQQVGSAFNQKMQERQLQKMLEEAQQNAGKGKAFLEANGRKPGVTTTDSGLQYQVIEAGNGPKPKPTDTVRVNYKGMLLDGTVFDDSSQHGGPAQIPLAQVVPGWQEGIALMPVGSKYRFWIPSELGYGESGTPGGPIPPNATLVFEVELLGIGEGN
ncbi:MAG TPA: FKBP-type peptidyl-prolyl cis-trans isomerase [Luteimonas sp.]